MLAIAAAADATHAKRRHPQRPPQPINLCATSAIFDTALMCLSLTQRSFSHPMQGRARVHHFPPSPPGSPHSNGVPLCRSARSSKKPGDIFRPAAPLSPVPHPPSSRSHPLPIFGRRRDDDAAERSGGRRGRRMAVGRFSIYRIMSQFGDWHGKRGELCPRWTLL